MARHVKLGRRLEGIGVVICAGPGGVGKTTTAAALALGLAREGRRVAVVTIDPARRLASSLGMGELDNEPRRVDEALLAKQGVRLRAGGELWAMMLDAKGTFDALISRLAPDAAARERVLGNRIYQEASSVVAGTQEFTAVAKLYELHREGRFDVIVLDTPPSRNALDFLDAPSRMVGFLEGRALRMFLAPGGLAARVVGRGTGLVLSMFSRFTGVDLLSDLSEFFGALAGMVDGFRERAHGVERLLHDPETAFLLVSTPEPEQVRETLYFAEQLAAAELRRAAVIVNRVHEEGLHGHSEAEVREILAAELGEPLAGRVAANLADFDVLASRDAASVARLREALSEPDPIIVPQLDHEVCDLASLERVAELLLA
ncbi:MAG TPA: ArsA-related P-loop ATPase [Solirubrobacteraceae bacterium]|nr:ArsA-related P-loop ATPase [Solirubrobacteraceae bacterium]